MNMFRKRFIAALILATFFLIPLSVSAQLLLPSEEPIWEPEDPLPGPYDPNRADSDPNENVEEDPDADPFPQSADGSNDTSEQNANANRVEKIDNPLGTETFEGLADRIGKVLIDIAIPVAVIIIIYAGFQYMTANGNAEKISSAHKTLLWTLVGVAVILIGKGFISLVKDLLTLRK